MVDGDGEPFAYIAVVARDVVYRPVIRPLSVVFA